MAESSPLHPNLPAPHNSKSPIDLAVDAICKQKLFSRADLRQDLLRFLVQKKKEGYFQTPNACRKELCEPFHRQTDAIRHKRLNRTDPESAFKRAINDLRGTLEKYYLGPGKNAEAVIFIPGGALPEPTLETWEEYRRHLDGNDRPAGDHAGAIPKLGDRTISTLHLYHLTRDHSGKSVWFYNRLKPVPDQHGRHSATAHLIPDADAGSPLVFDVEVREDSGHVIVTSRNRNNSADVSIQVFPHALKNSFPWSGASILTRSLHEDSAASISLLSDVPLACLSATADGAPISKFEQMLAIRQEWALGAKRAKLRPISQTSELVPQGEWDLGTIIRVLDDYAEKTRRMRPDQDTGTPPREVRIWTTVFDESMGLGSVFVRLAMSGVHVKVLMLNPANDSLIRAKYRLREKGDPDIIERAKAYLSRQIEDFNNAAKRHSKLPGSIRVQPCDALPFGKFFQIGSEVMLVGYVLPADSWTKGPLIKHFPGSQQWDLLERNWLLCWNDPLSSTNAGSD